MRLILLFLIVFSITVSAEVKHKDSAGFIVSGEIEVSGDATKVWKQLLRIDQWWEDSHSFSGKAANLYLDIANEKCFCEKWNDNWTRHLAVVHVQPKLLLVLEGGLGPLQAEGLLGALTIKLEQKMMTTQLSWHYKVHGYAANGIDSWAAPVDGVLKKQFDNLRSRLSGL